MHEKKHILQILEKTKEAIRKENVLELKELSNQTIHTASTVQDTDSIMIAIIVYSLGKIIEKKIQINEKKCSEFCVFASAEIGKAIKALRNDNEKKFKNSLETIMNSINKLSPNIKTYIQDVFQKSRINKASRIYEHGISMEQTAELLGITQYELANYAGQTQISDVPESKTFSVKDRIKLAMEMFE